jgi:hypothetical protein
MEFMHDNLFIEMKSKNGMNVIGCLNIQTCKWNILDFYSKLSIRSITGFEEGSLIILVEKYTFIKHYFYKIPFG